MSILEWTSKLVDSLAWPITTIVIVVLLKKPISNALLTISKLKFKDLEVDFTKEKEAVKEAAQKLQEKESRLPKSYKEPAFLSEARQIAGLSPDSAIMLTWKNLTAELSAAAHRNGMQQKSRSPVTDQKVIYTLKGAHVLNENIANLVAAMRELRNKTAHSHSETAGLTEQDAMEYIENASFVIYALQSNNT